MALIEHQKDKEEEIYFNFINSLKSPVTKQAYETNLKYYLDLLVILTAKKI